MTLWKVTCKEDLFPGMWQRWFKNQCVAVGWAGMWGYHLDGKTKKSNGWSNARSALKKMAVGDMVIVALRGHKVGRLGTITGKAITDDQWQPLVPKGPGNEDGEIGRRVYVRWELTIGPEDRDLVVQLPRTCTLSSGELRRSISSVTSRSLDEIVHAMRDKTNWVALVGRFKYEKALSDYIANYPNHLEEGLLPHPNAKIRELAFKDRSRLDVLLIDRDDRPVIVECKQYAPTVEDVAQLRHYMKQFLAKTGQAARGILVHGGARKLSSSVIDTAKSNPSVEIVSYRLEVDFTPSF